MNFLLETCNEYVNGISYNDSHGLICTSRPFIFASVSNHLEYCVSVINSLTKQLSGNYMHYSTY